MTCYGCGLPLWQFWLNDRREKCCWCLRAPSSNFVPQNFERQTYSPYHFVPPPFVGRPYPVTALRINALTQCPKQVRRKRLKEAGDHEHKDVYENYPGLFTEPAELDAMAKFLDNERRDLREWATGKLKSQLLRRAHALNLQLKGVRINKYADICKSWKANSSDANAKKMYEIMFGDFEGANVSWSHDMEEEYMVEKGRTYVEETNREDNKKIGCYRSQITKSKIELVKNINRNFEWKIQMSVPGEYEGDRTGRRKRGDFYLTNKKLVSKEETDVIK